QHRLHVRTECAGEKLLRLRHAFEHVRRLADDDGVDVLVLESSVEQRAVHGFAHQAGDAHIAAPRGVMRLSDANDRHRTLHDHLGALPSTQMRLCCKQCPCVAWAMARRAPATARVPARPESWRNTSPRRMPPVIISGLPQMGPPDGLITGFAASACRPSASQRISSSAGVAADNSSISASLARWSCAISNAFAAASSVLALRDKSRAPIVCISVRWST